MARHTSRSHHHETCAQRDPSLLPLCPPPPARAFAPPSLLPPSLHAADRLSRSRSDEHARATGTETWVQALIRDGVIYSSSPDDAAAVQSACIAAPAQASTASKKPPSQRAHAQTRTRCAPAPGPHHTSYTQPTDTPTPPPRTACSPSSSLQRAHRLERRRCRTIPRVESISIPQCGLTSCPATCARLLRCTRRRSMQRRPVDSQTLQLQRL